MLFEGERSRTLMKCGIRRWRIEDADSMANILNNRKILDNLRDGLPYPYTIIDAKEFIAGMMAADQEKTFAITTDENLRIFAEPFVFNKASCRVLEKAGFQCEGILRKNGIVQDMKMYALVLE